MPTKQFNVAVVGATGAVGAVMLRVLKERNFPLKSLRLVASERSAGRTLLFGDQTLTVEELDTFDFRDVDIGFFSAGGHVSKKYVPRAVEAGCVVIDNTSEFRYDDDVPLVVPEVNPGDIAAYKKRGIIANPNCSTIQMVVALKPLHDTFDIERINIATYQSVSGTGTEAINELLEQSRDILDGKPVKPSVYPHQIAFNVLPHIDRFMDNGYTREEMKMVWETHKILDARIKVNPTTVRVPVVYGHSEAVHIECAREISLSEAKTVLENTEGVRVIDERLPDGERTYPTAAADAADRDMVFVGRVRKDLSHPRGLNLWVVGDNLRKGAATNSVQIGEYLIRNYL